jgi:flagellar biosynthesis protein FliP
VIVCSPRTVVRLLLPLALCLAAPEGLRDARADDGVRVAALPEPASGGAPTPPPAEPPGNGAGDVERAPAAGAAPAPPPPRAKPPRQQRAKGPDAQGPRTPPGPRAESPASANGSPFGARADTAQALRIVLGLTVLAILPVLLMCLTSFLRIIVVLSMLRHAIGMNETPPNMVLTGLALFLTLFTMSPVLQRVDAEAFGPFMRNELSMEDAGAKGLAPLREFMFRQTREADLAFIVELAKAPPPSSVEDVATVQLIPAFMLSELRAAFQIGFVVFLPFLLIDLIVSSILMSLGMMMMPPTTISLPLKILMFVLVDGWSLLLKALVGSFH